MKRIVIVHGWGANPKSDWFPWLSDELNQKGYEVIVPEMPDTETPVIERWVDHLSKSIGTPDSNTFLIGHSIGCQTILRYAESASSPIGGALFVAGWFNLENMETEEEKKIAKPWIQTPIDHAKVKSNLPKSTLIISDNDDYGAFEENKKGFADIVGKVVVLNNAEHINGPQYPEILSEILSLAS